MVAAGDMLTLTLIVLNFLTFAPLRRGRMLDSIQLRRTLKNSRSESEEHSVYEFEQGE